MDNIQEQWDRDADEMEAAGDFAELAQPWDDDEQV